ncbi:MAG: adenylate/guanylate cyclase domain-containing protein [Sphingomonas sp.]|nr:adenylate/guanylate cyclase domain-containing protein [Sphingomonas sp.]
MLQVGADRADDEETVLRKVLVLLGALLIVPLALLWGVGYWFAGAHLAATIPWVYAAVSITSIAAFARHHSFRWLANSQLVLYLILPFALMWILGGFKGGSVVCLWALFAPLAALLLFGPGVAAPWLVVFLALVAASVAAPDVWSRPPNAVSSGFVDSFFVLNVGGVTTVAFALLSGFKGRREGLLASARGLVHRYLSADVAATLLADPSRLQLGGELCEATVFFADLRGFTSFSESVRPDVAVGLLNQYFTLAVPAIVAEGGTPIGFAGDEIMAIFNAPKRCQDHAMRAARAALEVQARIEQTADSIAAPRFGIGINTGLVLVGNVGSRDFWSFTAIGDTTNLAARLQALARPGDVVVGPETARAIAGSARLSPLGPVPIRGRSEPAEAFRLDGLLAVPRVPDPQSRPGLV